MGSCASLCYAAGTDAERAMNQQISVHMKNAEKEKSTKHTILLVGPGASGKTTILKQMRKIHEGTIPEDVVDSFSSYIRQKVVQYMKKLCEKSIELQIPLEPYTNDENIDIEESRQFMIHLSCPCDINPEITKHIKILWPNNGIQETLAQREKFQIPDNVHYFFNERLDDISSDRYIPTFEDYLRIRMRTTGINTETFVTSFGANGALQPKNQNGHTKIKSLSTTQTSTTAVNGASSTNNNNNHNNNNNNIESNNTPKALEYKDLDLETAKEQQKQKKRIKTGVPHTFTFMDVGGQRAERKKWITMLTDSIDAVVYVVAISEYDLVLFEEASTNRMLEALTLFEEVCKKGFMTNKTVTIFFNKYDLLVEKLQDETKSTIKDHFPEFPDEKDARNPDDVCEFVYSKFLEVYERCETKSNSVPHYHRTTALDTDQIDSIMADMQSDLIRNQLKLAGF